MRVMVAGGGPAGLYAALLLKKADPRRQVIVRERNARNATYGWGVVFTERTIASFREADAESHDRMTERFAAWDSIEVRYRGERLRCAGHSFGAIRRLTLLEVLHARSEELGVELQFEAEIADSDELSSDLLVAADGINSAVRRRYADDFRPSIALGNSYYVWLGTTKPFDAFTFIFPVNEHGAFRVHCYPFAGTLSTVIVECDETTWRRAGLNTASEIETVGYCEGLLASDLNGHRLLANASRWTRFPTLRCRTWTRSSAVLVGDAAHTAHFSIGSGTKLAMEDAIALARSVDRHERVEDALEAYEAERLPVIQEYQLAADDSRTYFEGIERYFEHDPTSFAFQLLTRSGRISYNEIALRDAPFADAVARDFSARSAGRLCGLAPPPVHVPLRLADLNLSSRVVTAPPPIDDAHDGFASAGHCGRFAQAGASAALVLAETVAVSSEGRIDPGCLGLYDDTHRLPFSRLVNAAREGGARVAVQLSHAGRRASSRPRRSGRDRPLPEREGGWVPLAPSALPYAPWSPAPRALDGADLARIRADFAAAAARAADAGVDLVEIHCAEGYLLGSFLSPLTNHREDGYGGDLRGRLRFPLEVLEAVRAVWPADRPLAVGLPASDGAQGGLGLGDIVDIAAELRDHGCDLVHVLSGQTLYDSVMRYGRGFLTAASDRIRNEASVPTMVGGQLVMSDDANTILAAARADLCVMALRFAPGD